MFPKQFLKEIEEGDIKEIFETSLERILEIDPSYGEHLMGYLFELAFADRTISKAEIDIIYRIGQEYLDLTEGEISRLFAEKIQEDFVPDFRAMC